MHRAVLHANQERASGRFQLWDAIYSTHLSLRTEYSSASTLSLSAADVGAQTFLLHLLFEYEIVNERRKSAGGMFDIKHRAS